MKLPNGFGTCYKQAGNRRRPWVVKKTINGKQTILGYYDSYEHGLSFLVDYNRDPALYSSDITFRELYERWKVTKFPSLSKSSISSYEISYKHCDRLYSMAFRTIRFGHLQDVIDDVRKAGAGYATQKKVRVLMGQLYAYAAKYDIVVRDYAQYIEVDANKRKYKKKPFTSQAINKLWHSVDELPGAADVLMMIYSGVRVGEYLRLETKDIKLRRRFFVVRESKTAAGRMRPVPIAKKVAALYKNRIENKYLCQRDDGRYHTYESFRRVFDNVMDELHLKHTPHETRHTCATLLDRAGANDTATKRILGHATSGVTKKVYTHKNLRDLHKAIDLI